QIDPRPPEGYAERDDLPLAGRGKGDEVLVGIRRTSHEDDGPILVEHHPRRRPMEAQTFHSRGLRTPKDMTTPDRERPAFRQLGISELKTASAEEHIGLLDLAPEERTRRQDDTPPVLRVSPQGGDIFLVQTDEAELAEQNGVVLRQLNALERT